MLHGYSRLCQLFTEHSELIRALLCIINLLLKLGYCYFDAVMLELRSGSLNSPSSNSLLAGGGLELNSLQLSLLHLPRGARLDKTLMSDPLILLLNLPCEFFCLIGKLFGVERRARVERHCLLFLSLGTDEFGAFFRLLDCQHLEALGLPASTRAGLRLPLDLDSLVASPCAGLNAPRLFGIS